MEQPLQQAARGGRRKTRLNLVALNTLVEARHLQALRQRAYEDATTVAQALREVIDRGLAAEATR